MINLAPHLLLISGLAFSLLGTTPPLRAEHLARKDRRGEPLPPGAVARLGSTRFLHGDRIRTLAFLPDGKGLISCTQESFFRLWDVTTGREIRRFVGTGSSFVSVVLSPDGKRVAASDNGGKLALWDVGTGKLLRRWSIPGTSAALAWAPDGKTLAVGTKPAIILYDPMTAKEKGRIQGYTGIVQTLVYALGGKVLLSATADKILRVWDPVSRKELRRLKGRVDFYGRLAVFPDGQRAAGDCAIRTGGGATRSVARIWDIRTGGVVRDIQAGSLASVAFSPDGKMLLTGSSGIHHLWDCATGKQIRFLRGHVGNVSAFAFSPDGKVLATGGAAGRIRLWNLEGKQLQPPNGHSGVVRAVTFAPSTAGKARGMLISGGEDNTIRFWDWRTAKQMRFRKGTGVHFGVRSLCCSTDGKRLVSVELQSARTVFRLWDLGSGDLLSAFGKRYHHAVTAQFLPDNNTLAAALWTGEVGLWDTQSGKLLRQVGDHKKRLVQMDISPDGQWVAWGDQYGHQGLWSLKGKKAFHFKGKDTIRGKAVAFSPDGFYLATLGRQGVQFWDLATGKKKAEWKDASRGAHLLTFSPDGRILAIASGQSVVLWDVWSQQEIQRFTGHLRPIQALAFADTGRVLGTGSGDGTILVWDVTGRLDKGKLKVARLGDSELTKQWETLGLSDASKAHSALWKLTACPQAAAFLAKKLRPVPKASPRRIKQLLTALDNDTFKVRQQATRQLARLGQTVRPALQGTKASKPTPEVRLRVRRLLHQLNSSRESAEMLRPLRAVSVLEQVGSPAARQVLQVLAKGAPKARLTQQARAALQRLANRNP